MKYQTLQDTQLEIIHAAFLGAFSDYPVEMNLPLAKFNNMLKRRGYSPEYSVGAFKDRQLIGFMLNGIGNWKGTITLYDCGTGVIPEYRRQGITSNMFSKVLGLLSSNNIEQYLLEVIQSNKPAVMLYMKQGFCVTRTFSCFRIEKNRIIDKGPVSTIKYASCGIDLINWELFKSFWEYLPSWQNSMESVLAVPNSFIAILARIGEDTVGYGIIDTRTGDIPQIAVDRDYRRKGIGRNLLRRLVQHTESPNISFTNVDNSCASILEFLQKTGFENFIDQYEMALQIKKRPDH